MRRRATPGSGLWSAVEASAQDLSHAHRREVARQMRAYLDSQAAPDRTNQVTNPGRQYGRGDYALSVGRGSAFRRNVLDAVNAPVPGFTWNAVGGGTTWGPAAYASSGGFATTDINWNAISVNLSGMTDSFVRLTTFAEQVAGKLASCDCGDGGDKHWDHSEEGCEFIPHQVQLGHVQ